MRRTLEEESRIEVVGEASTFAETMQMIGDFRPDVLILDSIRSQNRFRSMRGGVRAAMRRCETLACPHARAGRQLGGSGEAVAQRRPRRESNARFDSPTPFDHKGDHVPG